jgi:hypothetical protein
LKRGALPAAIALYFVLSMFMGLVGVVIGRHELGVLSFMLLVSVVGIVVLHRAIGVRLEALAEED